METNNYTLSQEQRDRAKKSLHDGIYWLLLYKEKEDPCLMEYFDSLMTKINVMNGLLGYPAHMIDLFTLLEIARSELEKGDAFNFKLYRKAVLDAESVVDKL